MFTDEYEEYKYDFNQELYDKIVAGEITYDPDNSKFIKYFEKMVAKDAHSKDGVLNVVGTYYVDGSDIQYFIRLDEEKEHLIIEKYLKQAGVYTGDRLLKQDTVKMTINKAKHLIKRVWFKNNKINYKPQYLSYSICSLVEILQHIAYLQLWEKQNRLHTIRFNAFDDMTKYYHYN